MHSAWLHEMVHWLQQIQAAGWLGWLIFIGLYAAACLTFVPGSVLTLGSGVVYGFWGGTLLVLIGNGLASILSLCLTRYLFRDWVQKQFDKHQRLRTLEDAVEKHGWHIVCLTRLSPIMPFSLINYALGLTKISALQFLLATEIGAIPSTCVYVYFGTLIGNLAKIGPDLKHHRPLEWILQGGGLLFTIGITIYITRIASKALKEHIDP